MAANSLPDLRQCTKCGETKASSEFSKDRQRPDGLAFYCRPCLRVVRRETYHRLGEAGKTARYQRNKDRNDRYLKAWRDENRETVRGYARRDMRKRRSTPKGRLESNVSRAVNYALKGRKGGGSTFPMLGYTVEELVTHLERQFTKGMSWDNYGDWHVDHIRPLVSFSYETPDDRQFAEAWALANLQPLWAQDNLKKGARAVLLA